MDIVQATMPQDLANVQSQVTTLPLQYILDQSHLSPSLSLSLSRERIQLNTQSYNTQRHELFFS